MCAPLLQPCPQPWPDQSPALSHPEPTSTRSSMHPDQSPALSCPESPSTHVCLLVFGGLVVAPIRVHACCCCCVCVLVGLGHGFDQSACSVCACWLCVAYGMALMRLHAMAEGCYALRLPDSELLVKCVCQGKACTLASMCNGSLLLPRS